MPSLFESMGLVDRPLAPQPPAEQPRTVLGTLGDIGLSLVKGAVAVPEAAVGLADVLTGGRAGQAAEAIGFRPRDASEILDQGYSDAQKRSFQNVEKAQGIIDTAVEALKNPSVIGHSILQSLPLMGAGGLVGRGAMALAPSAAPVAGAIGEGLVGAGSAAEQIRQQTPDGRLTGEQAALAGASGLATGLFGYGGSKFANSRLGQRLGIADVDTWLAGAQKSPVVAAGLTRRVLGGAVSEGLIEELPQSVSEQLLQNLALGKPLDDGVDQAAVLGLLSGGVMGAGFNAVSGGHPSAQDGAQPPSVPGNATAQPPGGTPPEVGPTLTGTDPGSLLTPNAAVQGMQEAILGAGRARFEDARQVQLTDRAMADIERLAASDEQMLAGGRIAAGKAFMDAAKARRAAEYQNVETLKQAGNIDAAATLKASLDKQVAEESTDPELRVLGAAGPMYAGGDFQTLYRAKRSDGGAQADAAGYAAALSGFLRLAKHAGISDKAIAKTYEQARTLEMDEIPLYIERAMQAFADRGLGKPMADVARALEQHRDAAVMAATNALLRDSVNGSSQPEAVGSAIKPATASPAPEAGAALENGFYQGPAAGERYRVSSVSATGGLALEKRLPAGTIATFYVGKDGALVDGDGVNLIGGGIKRLWIPESQSRRDAASEILQEMGALPLNSPRRAELKKRLKALVTGIAQDIDSGASDASNTLGTPAQPGAGDATGGAVRAGGQQDRGRGVDGAVGPGGAPAPGSAPGSGPAVAVGTAGGSDAALTAPTIDAGAHEAAASPLNDLPEPTKAQILAGNAKLGHVKLGPVGISVESPAGSVREDKHNDPPKWRTPMKHGYHYGYVKRTEAADSTEAKRQGIDVFVREGLPENYNGPVFVVDQVNKDGSFDEHKGVIGPQTEDEARADYLKHYEKGWKGLGAITQFPSVEAFDAWAKDGKKTEPLALKTAENPTAEPVAESQAPAPSEPGEGSVAPATAGSGPQLPVVESRSDGTLKIQGDPATIKTQLTEAGVPASAVKPANGGVVVGKTQADKAKAAFASKDDLEHLFGIDQKRAKALDRIAKGTAYFSQESKAREYIKANGLSDTHEAVRHASGANRWDVVAKAANPTAEAVQSSAASSAPAPAAEPTGPYARWRDAKPAERREMLRVAGYSDADQMRVLSGTDWNQLTDPVRRALSATSTLTTEKPRRKQPGDAGYTLLDARNDLLELRTIEQGMGTDANGRPQPTDDRLAERIRRQEKLVKELEDLERRQNAGDDQDKAIIQPAVDAVAKEAKENAAPALEPKNAQAMSRDEGIAHLEAGGKLAHLAGTEFEETIWIEENRDKKTWVVKSKEKGGSTTFTNGPAGVDRQWGWGRGDAARRASDKVTFKEQTLAATAPSPVSVPAPATTTAQQPSADTLRAQADLNNALADLGDLLGKPFRASILPEQEAKLVPILTRVLDAAFRLGFHKFKDAARFALNTIREKLGADVADALTLEHLQGAYIAMSGGKPGADGIMDVAKVTDKAALTEADNDQPGAPDLPVEAMAIAKAAGRAAATGVFDWASKMSTRSKVHTAILDSFIEQYPDGQPGASKASQKILDELLAESNAQTGPNEAQAIENQPTIDNTAGREANDGNATRKLDRPGQPALEGAPAGQVQAPDEVGPVGDSTEGGRGADGIRPASAEGGGGTGIGMGDGAGALPVPTGGAGRKPRGEPKSRAGRNARSAPDAGLFGDGTRPDHQALNAPNVAPPAPPAFTPTDFEITDDLALGEGGQKAKYRGNVDAIRLLKDLEATGRTATKAEQRVLARYVGWGGIAQAFDANNADWTREYAELKELLTLDEWATANESTQYAHYTSREIIGGIYDALARMGFTGGKILEPGSGVGNFVGLMPAGLRTSSRFTGVEREAIAVGIAKHLYPLQNIQRADFAEFIGNDGYFDLAIGNPPFARNPLTDKSGRKHLTGLSVHNYFFAKAVDMLRDGGILAQVVSSSFLDAKRDTARRYISDRVEFLGAIRLPNNAFAKNANTEVTTDIVFLRKLPESEWGSRSGKENRDRWLETQNIPDPNGGDAIAVNKYFADNPEMMLGQMGRFGTMYGPGQPALVARPGQNTPELLKAAIERLPQGIYTAPAVKNTAAATDAAIVALRDPKVHEGGHYVDDGNLYQRLHDIAGEARAVQITPETQWTEKTKLGEAGFQRIKALAGLRQTLRDLLAAELADSVDIGALRKLLNEQYDAYVAEHGLINDRPSARVFDDDPDYPLLASLEHGFTPGITATAARRMGTKPMPATAKKGPIFTDRVIEKRAAPSRAESPADALNISMAERGRIDAGYVGKLLGIDAEDALREMSQGDKPLLFMDPASNEYVLRDAYLSGNVRSKLAQARQAGMVNNARALEEVQPPDVGAGEISVRVGSPWVPVGIYEDFARHLFGDGTTAKFTYVKANSSYMATLTSGSDVADTSTWGTSRYPGTQILTSLMNNREIKVMYVDENKSLKMDRDATEAATMKATEVKQAFSDWAFSDPDRADVLSKAYNEANNNYVTRLFDGWYMSFPGKVPDSIIKFRRHQRNAIARIVQDRTALLDHVVGAGKTFTIISAAMELKRTGLANKPLIIVPNHLVKQWAADFYRLYPGANILTATKKDFEKTNRRRFLAKIATGNWDAVIMAHSSFGFIRPAPEFEAQFNEKQVENVLATIKAVEDADGDERAKKRTVKQLAALKERLENRIDALRQKPIDALLDFKEIGVDQLFVDEAHLFKNLMFTTKMQNVRGLGDAKGSQRAYDLFVKAHQLYAQNGRGQGVVFATGTPVSNSLAEMYHMMRYLMPQALQDGGFESFDAWANTFASVEQVWMQKISADGFKADNRMSNFVNTHELLKMFDQVADTVTMDDIKLAYSDENDGAEFPLPKLKGGRRQPVSLVKSKAQEEYMQAVAARAAAIEGKRTNQKGSDNALKIMGDARKAAMDIRLVDLDRTEREKGGRIDRAADEIEARYRQFSKIKGTQLVFSDLGTPLKHAKAEMKEWEALQERIQKGVDPETVTAANLGNEAAMGAVDDAEDAQREMDEKGADWLDAVKAALRGFSVYDDMRAALIERGIPESEIAFIHDYNTDEQKLSLFRKVNAGEIRVLMGSTPKLGAGTNVQERLVALHHLDVPWKPSDVEQREGRIIRQGNKLMDALPGFEVEILAYVTQDTLDMRMWQVQETKLKMINQLRTRQIGREIDNAFEDMEMSAGEMQAAATGNMDLLKEIQLRTDVKKLEQAKRSFDAQRNDLASRKRRAEEAIATLPAKIAEAEKMSSASSAYADEQERQVQSFSVTINGKAYTNPKEAGAVLQGFVDAKQYVKKGEKKGEDTVLTPEQYQAMEEDERSASKGWQERPVPLHVEMDGKTYTSRAALGEAFADIRGDANDPPMWNVDGQTFNRRTKAAAAIAQRVADALADSKPVEVGKIGPFTVTVEGQGANRYYEGSIDAEVLIQAPGGVEASTTLTARGISSEDDARKAAGSVINAAMSLASGGKTQARWLREDLNRQKKVLADLSTAKTLGEFPQQDKLEAARAAHKEVLARLSAKPEGKQEDKPEEPSFSRSQETRQAFEARIDALFDGSPANRVGVRVLDKSDVLDMLGLSGKPVVLQEGSVAKAPDAHPRMTAEMWKKVPQWMERPAAVFDSDTHGGLVFIGPELINGAPVRIIVEPDGRGEGTQLKVSLLVNAYDAPGKAPYMRWISDGMLRYVDTKEFPAIFAQSVGRQLPDTALQNKPGTRRILTQKNLAGYRRSIDSTPSASRGSQTPAGLTREAFRSALAEEFGAKVADRLEARGVVVALEDQSQLPAHVVPFLRSGDIVYGFYDPKTDRTYAVLSNLTRDMVRGLALHEVGVHYGFKAMLGEAKYEQVLKQIDLMHASGNERVRTARAEAKKNAVNAGQVPEETLAYLVQLSDPPGPIRSAIAAIKAWLFREFGIGGKYLTDADIVALARAAVKHSSRAEAGTEVPAFARSSESSAYNDMATTRRLQREWRAGGRLIRSKLSTRDEITRAQAAFIRIATGGGVTNRDDLRDLWRVPGYSHWASTYLARDVDAARALRDELAERFDKAWAAKTGYDGTAPTISDQGVITVSKSIGGRWDELVRIANKFQAAILVSDDAAKEIRYGNQWGFERFHGYSESGNTGGRWIYVGSSGLTANTPLYSRSNITDSEAFRRWFSGSKVVDEQGRPLVVYHGTTEDFSEFDKDKLGAATKHSTAGLGFYFTADPGIADLFTEAIDESQWPRKMISRIGANTIPVYLSIKNPKVLTAEQFMLMARAGGRSDKTAAAKMVAADVKALREPSVLQRMFGQTYDGVLVKGDPALADTMGGSEWAADTWVAFRPEQIKSATGNRGTFDPTNPDIRFSRTIEPTAIAAAARDTFSDLTSTSNTFNRWWHRTVGTQYHKAQKDSDFRRVFDSAQSYLMDVSRLANESADLARDLLPKLEHWRDVFKDVPGIDKDRTSGADVKASAQPVFEGTIGWLRDEDGRATRLADAEARAEQMSAHDKAQAMLRAGKLAPNVLAMWQGMTLENFEAAVDTRYQEQMLKPGVVFTTDELREHFNLTPKQIKLYQQSRAAIDKSIDDLGTSTIAKLLKAGDISSDEISEAIAAGDHAAIARLVDEFVQMAPDLQDLSNQIAATSIRVEALKRAGYAPLKRFGQYAVSLRDPETGDLEEFYLFESEREANKKLRELAGSGRVSKSVMSQEDYKLLQGINPESLELFGDILQQAGVLDPQDAVFQTYLRDAIAQRSALKRFIHREGYPGFSMDLRRVLADFITSNARLASKNHHFGEMLEAANAIPKEKGDVRDEAVNLVKYVQEPTEEAAKIRGLLFIQYIGGSVASALVNMTQSVTMTYPYLSQFTSPAKAVGLVSSAVRQAMGKASGDLAQALEKAEQSGVVSPQEIHHLNAEAGRAFSSHPAIQRAMFAWGSLFSLAEQFNRRVAFIAAWNTAQQVHEEDPYQFAVRAVEETQGVYNRGNRPNWARGAVGATLFTFKQFSISYLEFLARLPNRERALALAVLLLAAGAEGMPFADDLDDVIDTIAQRMGYALNSKEAKRRFMVNTLGMNEAASEFVLKGVSSVPGMPIDISGRMGMANLIPATGVLRKDVQDHSRDVIEIAGPIGSAVKDVIDGEWRPIALRNMAKGVDMFASGQYRDTKGRRVVDVDAVDAMWKSIGFQPAHVAQESLRARVVSQNIGLAKQVESEIASDWARGRVDGDDDAVQQAKTRLAEWNEANPEARIVIKPQQIITRMRELKRTREERIVKRAPAEMRRQVAEYMQ